MNSPGIPPRSASRCAKVRLGGSFPEQEVLVRASGEFNAANAAAALAAAQLMGARVAPGERVL